MVTHEPDIGEHCKRRVTIKDGLALSDELVAKRIMATDVIAGMKREKAAKAEQLAQV
jgi:hypothetical protein